MYDNENLTQQIAQTEPLDLAKAAMRVYSPAQLAALRRSLAPPELKTPNELSAEIERLSPTELLNFFHDRGVADRQLADRINKMDRFDVSAARIAEITANSECDTDLVKALREYAVRLLYNDTLPQNLPDGREIASLSPAEFFEFFDESISLLTRNELVPIIQSWLFAQCGKSLFAPPEQQKTVQPPTVLSDYEANRAFEKQLRERLEQPSLAIAVRCPATGRSARLRYLRSGTSSDGQFYFEHREDGVQRKKSRSKTFPIVELLDLTGEAAPLP
ncbi:MAG: hypothetical protein KDB23_02410 [Planctomycetales bacterium]|nr:hypothetical protein [Planctomycetales bacterium]